MNIKTLTMVSLAATMAACSSTPPSNADLVQAHQRYMAAENNPQVTRLAPEEMKQAGDALAAADEAQDHKAKPEEVSHLAYLANQQITVAMDTASTRASQAVTANAAAERDRLRLQARTEEADQAKAQLAALQEQYREMNARKTDRGMVVTLGDVLFDTGKAQLLPASQGNMIKLAEFFKKYPQETATIDGYTDNVGGDSYNVTLSQRRADAVKTALVQLGVPSTNLTTQAHGKDNPTADNSTASGRQMNRRVEVVFADQTPVASAQ